MQKSTCWLSTTSSFLKREVWGSNFGPVKLDAVLPTACHCCDISSKEAVLPGRNDAEMGTANSLHVSERYSENIERFDLIRIASDILHWARAWLCLLLMWTGDTNLNIPQNATFFMTFLIIDLW